MKYTAEMIEFLREVTSGKTYKEITELFNKKFNLDVTAQKMKSLLSRKKINTGTRGCLYKKGKVPWNKGKKGYMGANRTSFKKGHKPKNWRPVGSERVDKDGYTLTKIAEPKKWALKHRVIWGEHHKNKVPKGSVIIFADGDRSNFSIENLICVSRNELRVLNKCSLIKNDVELTKTGLNVAKIRIKLAELKKEKK
nr:MAG TPA: HNH endonuclease [Caudoviricetes sp.]